MSPFYDARLPATDAPEDLERRARERGWPPGLVERALALRLPPSVLRTWLSGHWATPQFVERRLEWHERLTFGSLRGREATLADNDAFSELWANAPEDIGEWEVTTERSPYAFAQFRLQENLSLLVIEEKGILVACCAFAVHNVLVGGKRLTMSYGQALRVHKDYRRLGYGDQVRSLSRGVGAAAPNHGQYDYMRSQNFAVVHWWKKYAPSFFDNIPDREGDVPGISVTVLQYPSRRFEGDRSGIRRVRAADISRCVGLINRTHRGQDLFRPYTADFLRNKLSERFWGERPERWPGMPHVYGWEDCYVLEEDGRVVACAGLWDRGRDIRDRWKHKETGEEKVIEVTALLDFGYEDGREAAMARLIAYLIGVTHELGRDYLTAPLDQLPAVAAKLERFEPAPETRALRWELQEPAIRRPYTDLVYW